MAEEARADPAPSSAAALITASEPAGFAGLSGSQMAVIDLYFGGKRVGDARIRFQGNSLTFLEPDKIIGLLPSLTDPARVLSLFARPGLAANVERVCLATHNHECGSLTPETVGIIFDQDRFRADVFVNPRLLAVRPATEQQYLLRPEPGLSLVDSLGLVIAGSSEAGHEYSFQNQAVVASGNTRLRSDLALATGFGLQADRLAVEVDRPGVRYSAGALWAPGVELTGRRKIIGAGVSSQYDTRLDKEQIQGTPLVVFLNQRSKVDILREGRVIASSIQDAGNQQLDTSMFPEGAYQVTVRVQEAGGRQREEIRFFARSPRIAAVDRDIFFAYAGLVADDRRAGLLALGGKPFLQAGYARRISTAVELDASLMASDRTVLGELGSYLITLPAQLRVAAIAASDGSHGGVVSLSSQGHAHFNFNFDLRHINVGSGRAFAELVGGTSARPQLGGAEPFALDAVRGSFTQLNGVASYGVARAQLLLSAALRRDRSERTSYTVGPSFRWEVLRAGLFRATVKGDLAFTTVGRSGFLGLNLQLLGPGSTISSGIGLRSRKGGSSHDTSSLRNLEGAWQVDEVAGGALSLGAGFEDDEGRRILKASADLRGNRLALSGDVGRNLGQGGKDTQYSLGFQTALAASNGRVSLNGRNGTDSTVVVEVSGARKSDSFEILVNETVAGLVAVGKPLSLPLPSYRQYKVRVRPTGAAPLRYDDTARTVALYPGNVPRLVWVAEPVVAMFGRIVLADGTPISGAQISGGKAVSQTDERGYFQIEAIPGTELEVVGPDGGACQAILPTVSDAEAFASVGPLTCRRGMKPIFAGGPASSRQPETKP